MNAKEAMQALLDGKTLERDNPWYLIKLNDKGNLVACDTKNLLKKGEFRDAYTLINNMDRIYEEYPLTFEQALTAMLDGKVVMCKEPFHGYAYRFHNGRFEDSHVNDCFTRWEQCGIPSFRQNSKWKVVE